MLVCFATAVGLTPALARPPVAAIGIENQYADVIQQIGGRYVQATAIESNPNTDPHSFEASPQVARQIARATLIVMNGLGYDGWANKLIGAAPNPRRIILNVQHLMGLKDSTPNPHLWYDPATMPIVARAVAAALARQKPAHAGYFAARLQKFVTASQPWLTALAGLKARYAGTKVAVTEPVGDYLLQAAGFTIETPFNLQAAIMNGTDPSPQNVATQNALLGSHEVKIFVYNQQVTDPLTNAFLERARQHHIPVVGVYETMPAPGYTYQSWMLAEVQALNRAISTGTSTRSLMVGK